MMNRPHGTLIALVALGLVAACEPKRTEPNVEPEAAVEESSENGVYALPV